MKKENSDEVEMIGRDGDNKEDDIEFKPNDEAGKGKMMKPMKTRMKRKRKKKVMSCKILGIQTFTFLSLSLSLSR